MKKLVLALATMSTVVFGFGMGAQAQYVTPPPPQATVTPASLAPGGDALIGITGCPPGSTVAVVFNGATSTVTSNASGASTATVKAPAAGGTYPGTATCGTVVASFSVVVAAPVVPVGGLPPTGLDGANTTTGIAIGLLVIGLGLFGVAQVRRRQTATA